jgi:hypothetical protein
MPDSSELGLASDRHARPKSLGSGKRLGSCSNTRPRSFGSDSHARPNLLGSGNYARFTLANMPDPHYLGLAPK